MPPECPRRLTRLLLSRRALGAHSEDQWDRVDVSTWIAVRASSFCLRDACAQYASNSAFFSAVVGVNEMRITFARTEDAFQGFETLIRTLIEDHHLTKICDIGGGGNPLLPIDYVSKRNLSYTILDISEEELRKAPNGYRKLLQDIMAPHMEVADRFELVFSKMLAEHVFDGMQFHKNVYSILANGGIAVHFFPTLYAFPFLINRLVPERLARLLLNIFHPRDMYQHGKFPAYYSWCRGPTKNMLRKLEKSGYEIVEYRGFFGHADYYRRIPILRTVHKYTSEFLLKHPNSYLTSYAYAILKKPNNEGSKDKSRGDRLPGYGERVARQEAAAPLAGSQ
jgi:hypothetical protein